MSNSLGLTKVDSQLIGEREADPELEVTEPDAIIASGEAGIESDVVTATRSRAIIGRFAAASMSGYLIGDTIRDQAVIERAVDKLSEMMGSEKNPDIVVKVADAMAKLFNARTNNRAVLLKAVEISAQRGRRKSRRSNAPQGVIEGNTFNAPVQINGAAPAKTAA